MGADLETLLKFWPEFETYLWGFFSDKYDDRELRDISSDIKEFFREEYIDQVQFVLYDINERKVTQAISFKIGFEAGATRGVDRSVNLKIEKISPCVEKIIVMRLTKVFFKNAERDSVLRTLKNRWDFTGEVPVNISIYHEFYSEKDRLRIQLGEMGNE